MYYSGDPTRVRRLSASFSFRYTIILLTMSREKMIFFVVFALGAAALAYGNTLAIRDSLYGELRWFDIPIHFLAGFLVGWTYFSIWFRRNSNPPYRLVDLLIGSLISVIIIGVSWEILEWRVGLAILDSAGRVDTVIDLIIDCVGAAVAAVFSFKLFSRELLGSY